MLTLTSKYALRAMIYLARHRADWPIPGRRIAEQTEIPRKYLSKILGDLARAGVLRSSPGRSGGFRLSRPAKETKLLTVLEPFEQFSHDQCPFDNEACGREHPCRAHIKWARILEARHRFLEGTSVEDVADEAQRPKPPQAQRRKK